LLTSRHHAAHGTLSSTCASKTSSLSVVYKISAIADIELIRKIVVLRRRPVLHMLCRRVSSYYFPWTLIAKSGWLLLWHQRIILSALQLLCRVLVVPMPSSHELNAPPARFALTHRTSAYVFTLPMMSHGYEQNAISILGGRLYSMLS